MAHRKAGGSAKNLTDSNPKYLGIKKNHQQKVKKGQIIVRQRGTKFLPGENVKVSKDHTIHSLVDGYVKIVTKNKTNFTGKTLKRKFVGVVEK